MIDTHCHILPGIDDGARTVEQAVAMARMAAADGIRVIVATPHWNAVTAPLDMDFVAQRVAELSEHIHAAGIDIELLPGAEVALTPDLIELADAGSLPTLCGSKYILVEATAYLTWDVMRHILFELQLRGLRVIIAHPERAGPLLEDRARAEELSSGGVRLQVVASDLARRWSNAVGHLARWLIKRGLADLLATDAHDTTHSPPRLSRLRRLIERLGGRGTFQRLTQTNPAAILDSRP